MSNRIDAHVAFQLNCSKSKAQQLIKSNNVLVNDKLATKASYKVKAHDKVVVKEGALESLLAAQEQKAEQLACPEPDDSVKFEIVSETKTYAVVNKPYGLTVHPGAGNESGTLVNGLLHRFGADGLSSQHDTARPGIVHRLDKDTSGLMVVALNDAAHAQLQQQFEERSVSKVYRALVAGKPPCSADPSAWNRIDRAIVRSADDSTKMAVAKNNNVKGAKPSQTDYRVVRCWRTGKQTHYTLLELRLLTGRTHQIRVHLSSLGTPIVGDIIYSRQSNKQRVLDEQSRTHLMLAAVNLEFNDPESNERVSFQIDMPDHMQHCVELLDEKCDVLKNDSSAAVASTKATKSNNKIDEKEAKRLAELEASIDF